MAATRSPSAGRLALSSSGRAHRALPARLRRHRRGRGRWSVTHQICYTSRISAEINGRCSFWSSGVNRSIPSVESSQLGRASSRRRTNAWARPRFTQLSGPGQGTATRRAHIVSGWWDLARGEFRAEGSPGRLRKVTCRSTRSLTRTGAGAMSAASGYRTQLSDDRRLLGLIQRIHRHRHHVGLAGIYHLERQTGHDL